MKTPFLGSAYTSKTLPLAAQTLVNLYLEMDGSQEGSELGAFLNAPGALLYKIFGVGPIRGMHVANGDLYVTSGNQVFRETTAGVVTLVGTLGTSAGLVSMEDNGLQLVIADTIGWQGVDLTTQVMAAVLGAPTDSILTYQDGYVIFTRGGDTFGITDLSNAFFINALDFASAEGAPDDTIAVLADHRELWLFGERTIEVWFNTGAAAFPFERSGNAFIEHGCAARRSVAKMDNSVFWLGRDDKGAGIVSRSQGYSPSRISTHALETAIGSYGDISDAQAYCYQQEGHSFYVLTFPSANRTWAFDAATETWSERCYRASGGSRGRTRANAFVFWNGMYLTGDYVDGRVYSMRLDQYTDDGDAIYRERAWAHVEDENHRIRHNRLELIAEMGVGLQSGQGSDPQVFLQWSDDGGRVWSNEHWRSVGKVGQYERRAYWNKLGMARRRIYRLATTDPVKVAWIGANLNAQGLAA